MPSAPHALANSVFCDEGMGTEKAQWLLGSVLRAADFCATDFWCRVLVSTLLLWKDYELNPTGGNTDEEEGARDGNNRVPMELSFK